MGKAREFINSFLSGEWSRRMDGFVHSEGYRNACRELTNFLLWPLGMAQTRAGFEYKAATFSTSEKSRLHPVTMPDGKKFLLEFTTGNLRIVDVSDFSEVYSEAYSNALTISEANIYKIDVKQIGYLLYIIVPGGHIWKLLYFQLDGSWKVYTNFWTRMAPWVLGRIPGNGVAAFNVYDDMTEQAKWNDRDAGKFVKIRQNIPAIKMVAVGDVYTGPGQGAIITSPDGITWTARTSGIARKINDVAFNGNIFVAVGQSTGFILTSPDGITWTIRSDGVYSSLFGADWGNGLFIVTGAAGEILTSPDGVTWTQQTSGVSLNNLFACAWIGSFFITVGNSSGVGEILTSLDGVTWTQQTSGSTEELHSIAWNDNILVVVGGTGEILTSPDGITWTQQTSGVSVFLYDVIWNGSLFVVVGSPTGGAGQILTSPDGVTWTARTSGTASALYGVNWDGTQFIIVGDTAIILTSPDGITWTIRASGIANLDNINGIAVNPTIEFSTVSGGKTLYFAKRGPIASIYWPLYTNDQTPATGTGPLALIGEMIIPFADTTFSGGFWHLEGGGIANLKFWNPDGVGIEIPAVGEPISILYNEAPYVAVELIENGTPHWTASGSGTNEYHYAGAWGPAIEPLMIYFRGAPLTFITSSSIGSLPLGHWSYGDNDAIGSNKLYVRLPTGYEPDPDDWATSVDAQINMFYVITDENNAATWIAASVKSGDVIFMQGGLFRVESPYEHNTMVSKIPCVTLKSPNSISATGLWQVYERFDDIPELTDEVTALGFYQNRLVYSIGNKIYMSGSGDYDNFPIGVDDTDSVVFNLSEKAQWMEERDVLVVGTDEGEHIIGARGVVTTPTQIFKQKQTNYGSDGPLRVLAQNNVLFVQKGATKLREIGFDLQTESYNARDLTILADNIVASGIKQIAYARRPIPTVYCVTGDGTLACMTYITEQGVFAWHEYETGMTAGAFDGLDDIESIAVIPGDIIDDVYITVKRTINSVTKRYIEKLAQPYDSTTISDARQLDSFLVDTGLNAVVTGLDHLDGETVTYIVDGDPTKIGTATVASNQITMLWTPTVNAIVGVPYTCVLQTMRLEAGGQKGPSQGLKKRIGCVLLRLYQSLGGKVGPTSSNTHDIPDATTQITGDRKVKFPGGWNEEGYVTVVQDQPLSLAISAISPDSDTSDDF